MGWDVFGFFPDGPQYTVIGGWSLTGQQLYIGFTRLLYPFLCGLLISRILPAHRNEENPSGSPIHLKGGFWWCSLALVVLFSVPCIGGKTGIPDGLFQAICILLLFPLIVLTGSGSVTKPRKKLWTISNGFQFDQLIHFSRKRKKIKKVMRLTIYDDV